MNITSIIIIIIVVVVVVVAIVRCSQHLRSARADLAKCSQITFNVA